MTTITSQGAALSAVLLTRPLAPAAQRAARRDRRWRSLSTIAGLLVGPVKLPVGGVLHELAHHLPFLSIGHGLPPTDALILDQLRAAARRARA